MKLFQRRPDAKPIAPVTIHAQESPGAVPELFAVDADNQRLSDAVVRNKGVQEYSRLAVEDAEIASCLLQATTLMLPGLTITPDGEDDDALRNAAFIQTVLDAMPGSQIDVFREQILRNAVITGMSVAEPVFMPAVLPEWGKCYGLSELALRPTESFHDAMPSGIDIDMHGHVIGFRQSAFYGNAYIEQARVFYYAFRGSPDNRYGTSLIRAAYDAALLKERIQRIYGRFAATNASGYKVLDLPDGDYNDKRTRELAQAALDRLGTAESLVKKKGWELEINQPGAGTGEHFRSLLDYCNEEIRKAMLGDAAFSSQAGQQGSRASREVSQGNVTAAFRAIGRGFCEELREQLFTDILRVNGYSGPVPILEPQAPVRTDEAREGALAALSEARSKGLISMALPESAQLAIYRAYLGPVGIEVEELSEAELTPEPEEKPAPVQAAEVKHVHAAEDPERKRLRKAGALLVETVETRAAELGETWTGSVLPAARDYILSGLFDASGAWKTTDLTAVRQLVVERCRYKQSEVRKVIVAALEEAYEQGATSAKPPQIQAATVGVNRGWTPTMARKALANRVLLLLEERYGVISSMLYYAIEDCLTGITSPYVEAKDIIARVLENYGFNPVRARTVLDTAMHTAWNHARMEQYRQFENADGTGALDIVAYEFMAVEDDYTTEACLDLQGIVFSVDDPALPQPPLHYNCRSKLRPIYGNKRDTVQIVDRAESARLVAELRAKGGIQEGFGGI